MDAESRKLAQDITQTVLSCAGRELRTLPSGYRVRVKYLMEPGHDPDRTIPPEQLSVEIEVGQSHLAFRLDELAWSVPKTLPVPADPNGHFHKRSSVSWEIWRYRVESGWLDPGLIGLPQPR